MTDHLAPHTTLHDRYNILGLLGTGGMGAVYLADDQRLIGRKCAIKETRFSSNLSAEVLQAARQQFYQEASILAQLDHPGLPKVSNFFSEQSRDYLVMDFVPGDNLQEIVQHQHRQDSFLPTPTVLDWVAQLCDTLAYLHTHHPSILHRDIKPANIKLTPSGHIKLVDFGLVKPLDPDDPSTLTGFQGVGSLPYAPLEQYLDHLGHTDARSDLYALGATIYHLLTNTTPASAQERFLSPESLPPIQSLNPAVPARLAEVVLQAMAPHPKDRPTSVADWFALLHQTHQASAATGTLPTRQEWTTVVRQTWWLILLTLLLFGLAAWITFAPQTLGALLAG